MEIERRFFMRHQTTGKPICLVQGKLGFFPATMMLDAESDDAIDAKLAAANSVYGNTPADITAAEGCSMFGWDIPLAKSISDWGL